MPQSPASNPSPEGQRAAARDGRVTIAIFASVFVALLAAVLLLSRSNLINGSDFWRWGYQASPVELIWVFVVAGIVTALCAIAFRIHQLRRPGHRVAAFTLLALAAMLLRLSTAWMFSHEVSLRFVDYAVRNPVVGSYFSVAQVIADRPDVLAKYPEWMASMPLHAVNKPPGLALFNVAFIKLFGNGEDQQTAGIVGFACGLLSLGCIPLSYAFVRSLGGSERAGFHAAGLWALSPGAAIFFPLFDPVLTLFSLSLAVCWIRALRFDRYMWSLAMGGVLAVTLFFTFNVLPIGLFLLAAGWFATRDWSRAVRGPEDRGEEAPALMSRAGRLLRHAVVVVAVAALLHLAFHAATGFDLIATLRAALANQKALLAQIPRPYPATIWWDLIDYALGVAWIPVVLAGVYLSRLRRPLKLIDLVVLVGLGQLVIVAVTALLPGETSRVWNFLIPLILLPAALELERWPRWLPTICYGAMACLTALLARSLVFMYAG